VTPCLAVEFQSNVPEAEKKGSTMAAAAGAGGGGGGGDGRQTTKKKEKQPRAAGAAAAAGDDRKDVLIASPDFILSQSGIRLANGGKGGRLVVGAHAFLNHHFWAKKQSKYTSRGDHPAPRAHPRRGDEGQDRKVHMSASDAAKYRGIATDEHITHWVEHGSLPSNWNFFARTFLSIYEKMKLKPISAQGIVGIAKSNVGTPYDVLMEDEAGNLYIIENKTNTTGKAAFEDSRGKYMRNALRGVPCSPKNRSIFQGAFTLYLYNYNAREAGCRLAKGFYVARAGRAIEDADVYGVEEWVARGLEEVERILQGRSKPPAPGPASGAKRKAGAGAPVPGEPGSAAAAAAAAAAAKSHPSKKTKSK
jgi:hypothetical protein